MSSLDANPSLLGNLPKGLRNELLKTYNQILKNYRENRWEPSALNGGKLCEVIYSILAGLVAGKYPSRAKKPSNMVDACRVLEQADKAKFARAVRIQIPRVIIALYEIRNNRGVGHVGGDVDPNHMDATAVVAMARWLMAELVRFFHAVDTEEATRIVDAITDRALPLLWSINGKLRVLNPSLGMKDKALVMLYQIAGPVSETDLVDWVEHSNPSVFRRDVLRTAHRAKLIEYDASTRTAVISPLGLRYVEEQLDLEV